MLTKAILTGGVLALLSGSIVYFGTEGADALDNNSRNETRFNETELAGAADSEAEIIKTVEPGNEKTASEKTRHKNAWSEKAEEDSSVEDVKAAQVDPINPTSVETEGEPKTKWLDQYLKTRKASKEDAASDPETEDLEEADELEEMDPEQTAPVEKKSLTIEAHDDGTFRYSDGTIVEDEDELKYARRALEAIEDTDRSERRKRPANRKKVRKRIVVNLDDEEDASWTTTGEDIELELMEELMQELEGSEKDVRILRFDGRSSMKRDIDGKSDRTVDYNLVLDEARKLQVIDMRNIAFFEIIDYAIDRKDFGQAADVLEELSDPELRDTARAKIGVGLAKTGDSEAAFAVLDEMEIDELTASMRLEIITALMATKAERVAPAARR